MKAFIIKENDSNQRLDKFLQKAVPLLPQNLMYKYIRLKRIKVNGKKSDIKYKLLLGDKIELYINDEFFLSEKKSDFLNSICDINILYQDENIMIIDKPSGLVVHEDNENATDTLINRVLHYLYIHERYNPDNELSFRPSLVNRIDRNTSGIVMVAKNADSLRVLSAALKDRQVKKFYLCIVNGHLEKEQDILKHYLQKNANESMVKIFDKPNINTKTIVTKYKVLSKSDKNSLLEVELLTGRTHQIRAHMAYIHHPILGDGKYGKNSINKLYSIKHQLLYSYKLKFEFINTDHCLSYLQNKEFKVSDIWFKKDFLNGKF